MYFPFFRLHQRSKRSTIRPKTICSEIPYVRDKRKRSCPMLFCWDRSGKCSCGATRLGECSPTFLRTDIR